MSSIRFRPDTDLAVSGGVGSAVQDAGFVSGAENSLMDPGSASMSTLKVDPTSRTESATAALRETIAARALRGWDYINIPSEEGFDVTSALGERASQFNEDELEFLADSRSTTEMGQRLAQVTSTRQNQAAMAANPLTSMAASLLDADLIIGLGVGKAAGVARSARLVAGLTANAAVLGLASEGGDVSALEIIGTSLGVSLGAVPKMRVPAAAAEDVAPVVRTVDDVVPVDGVPLPTRPAQATAEELAATDTTIQIKPKRDVPDPDYVAPELDMATTKRPYLEIGRTKGRVTMSTSTGNFVRGVVSNADDMPAGSRLLGAALADSLALDGDVPLLLARGDKRSNVKLYTDGSMTTSLYTEAGGKKTLTETIQSMTPYEKTIALHEAAHAKTESSIHAFKNGTLKAGHVYDAVKRIDDIRQHVKGALTPAMRKQFQKEEWANNVMYGVNDTSEFVSQLFNSEAFRKVLDQVKLPGSTTSVWSELVQRVVQAFTGKAPGDTALTGLVAAFEDLLKLPAENPMRAAAVRQPKDVPTLQTAMLQAPNATAMAHTVGAAINKNFALYDAIKAIGTKAGTLADQLVVDATGTSANSATHYARTAHLAANVAAAQVDAGIRQALQGRGWSMFSRMRNPRKFLDAQRSLSEEVYAKLADNHARYRDGATITPHADAAVESIIQSFVKSDWAEGQLQRIKASGMQGSDLIESSPYYLPRRHNGAKVSQFLRDNPNVTRADIEKMYGSQFLRMFADKGMKPDTANSLGRQMLRNMEQRADGVSGYRQHIAGMGDEDIEFAMRNAGIDEDQIQSFLNTVAAAGKDANTVRNLRRRAEFNMTEDYVTSSGATIHPQMFVDKDVLGLMEGYSRTMSGRIGLAQAGFPDVKSLAKAIDEAAAEGTDTRAARKLLDDTANRILGYQTGEDVPDILRSFSVLSGATALANSGIYQIADTALLMKQFGITKTLRAMTGTQWGRDALKLAQDPAYGKRLQDVLEARLVLSGRYRTVLTHLDDNTDIGSMGMAHQMIQQMGQSTRFVNGMEYVRRGQSKLTAGLVADSMEAAIKGDAAAVEALKRFGITDELLLKARAANLDDLRSWPDSLRLDMETVAHNMADALVLENRLGEIPAWMQFSALGKVILPYMTFVAGTWNKILRREYAQDGAKGVAMMFAYQLPLSTISSTVALSQSNKDLTPENILTNTLTQVPLMSWMGYAVNMATQGPTNSIAALGLVDKTYSAFKGVVSGDPDPLAIVKAVPFAGIIPGMRIFATAVGEED